MVSITTDGKMPNLHRQATWSAKGCDVCLESVALEGLGKRIYLQQTRSAVFEFKLDDVLCRKCGFVFAAQFPDDRFLREYYADAFTLDSSGYKIDPDFD